MARPRRVEPGPGQESVWDYPRPPRAERTDSLVRVEHRGVTVAETTSAWRVLETSQPPAYYLPPEDVATELLRPAALQTFCEWKGMAAYADLVVPSDPGGTGGTNDVVAEAAWCYPDPVPAFAAIRDHWAFYAQRVDACFVDGERVQANEGGFYGGWITSRVVGPFKGGAGTRGW